MKAQLFDTRPMPSDLVLERAILGWVLANGGEILLDLQEVISQRDFNRPEHAALWDVFVTMAAEHKTIDIVTVAQHVEGRGEIYGGLGYIAQLPEQAAQWAHVVPEYAEALAELAARRRLIDAGLSLREQALNNTSPPEELAVEFAAHLLELGKRSRTKRRWSFAESIAVVEEQRLDRLVGADRAPGMPTGIPELDGALGGGVPRGDLVVIGGQTSMGKSALATSICSAAARTGRQVLYVSVEMAHTDISSRCRAYLSGLPLSRFTGPAREDQAELLAEVVDETLAIEIVDWPGANVDQIVGEVRRLWMRGSMSAFIVDHLHCMDHRIGKGETKASAIGRTTGAFQRLARELNVTGFLLAQLNRGAATRPRRELKGRASGTRGPWWEEVELPELSDLRDSGSIEQDASTVLFPIHAEMMGVDAQGAGAVVIAKQRNGPRTIIGVRWDGPSSAYRPYGRAK